MAKGYGFLSILLASTILVSSEAFAVYESIIAIETEAAAEAAMAGELSIIFNWGQYALLIMETLEENETNDATKEVTVKGAEELQTSQGEMGGGASLAASSSPMETTTISAAAVAMNQLLRMGEIDMSLLSTDVEMPKEEDTQPQVLYQDHAGGIASTAQSGTNISGVKSTGRKIESELPQEETSDDNSMTTYQEQQIKKRRSLLLSEWATAATQIGEGSNAISAAYNDRASGFVEAANEAEGSLGGITTITDTDRFVLFELTRGAALSAVGLGLQGATNLNDMTDVATGTASGDDDDGDDEDEEDDEEEGQLAKPVGESNSGENTQSESNQQATLQDVQAAAEKQGVVISAIAVEVDRDKIVSEANRILNSQ